jgi:hypothetical protein
MKTNQLEGIKKILITLAAINKIIHALHYEYD